MDGFLVAQCMPPAYMACTSTLITDATRAIRLGEMLERGCP